MQSSPRHSARALGRPPPADSRRRARAQMLSSSCLPLAFSMCRVFRRVHESERRTDRFAGSVCGALGGVGRTTRDEGGGVRGPEPLEEAERLESRSGADGRRFLEPVNESERLILAIGLAGTLSFGTNENSCFAPAGCA